jgi:hypothetical protein
MSSWTHVLGILKVEPIPCRTQAEGTFILDSILHHLPKVCGSESGMSTSFRPCNGYNLSSSHDELGDRTNNSNGHYNNFEVNTMYLLTIEGDFRDTTFSEQIRQTQKWLDRISKRILVCDVSIHLYSDYGEVYNWNTDMEDNFDDSYICNYMNTLWLDK